MSLFRAQMWSLHCASCTKELEVCHPVVSIDYLERAVHPPPKTDAEMTPAYDPRFPEHDDRADVDAVLDHRWRGRGKNKRQAIPGATVRPRQRTPGVLGRGQPAWR